MRKKLLSILALLCLAVSSAWAETIDLSEVTASKTAQDGDVLIGTLDGTTQKYKISIADGATVTLDGVSINGVTDGAADASLSTVNWAGLTCEGNATIILKEGTTNTVRGFYHRCPGIFIPQGYTLTIEGPGTLNASGSISTEANHVDKKGNLITCAPGIGSAVLATAGNIVINGGTINATGGWASASIGGNFLTGCGNITITGGTVNATGSLAAAGIGGGWVASCGDIVITGGTINATGGDYINSDATGNDGGPAIGGSPCGSCGTITIGGTANVTATKGLGAPYSIGQGGSWNGVSASCGTVTVFGVEGQISDSPYNAAIYDVTFADGLTDWTATPTSAAEGETITLNYTGKKKVKTITITKKAPAGPTYPVALSAVTSDYVGSVVTTDGNVYATVADATTASKTAAAMIAYIDTENNKGLAIALSDEASEMNFSTATGETGAAAHTPTVSGQAWKLPSQNEWKQIFGANGGSQTSYTGLNTAIGNAGGTALVADKNYWTSTEMSSGSIAYRVNIAGGKATFNPLSETLTCKVRACLEFDIAASASGPEVTPTANANEWTFEMPAYDVEVKVEYETALALSEVTDNTATLEEWDGYEADVTLTRTLQADGWNTFAAPFSADAETMYKLATTMGLVAAKELESATLENGVLTLNFANATELVAGKPYLVKVAANIENPTFANVEVSKTLLPTETAVVDFIPTLGATTITGDNAKEVLFLAADNKLLNPKEMPASIKGFRAYFQLKSEASAVKSFRVNLGEDDADAINAPLNDKGQMINDNAVYDLSGRMVNGKWSNGKLPSGVYIMNGKKTIIK